MTQTEALDEKRRLILLLIAALPPAAWAGYLSDRDLTKEKDLQFRERPTRESKEYRLGEKGEHDLVEHYRDSFSDRQRDPYGSNLDRLELNATNPDYHLLDYDANDPLDPYGLLDKSYEQLLGDVFGSGWSAADNSVSISKLYLQLQQAKLRAVALLAKATGGDTKRLLRLIVQLERLLKAVKSLNKAMGAAEFLVRYFSADLETRMQDGYTAQVLRDTFPMEAWVYDQFKERVYGPVIEWSAERVESADRQLQRRVRQLYW